MKYEEAKMLIQTGDLIAIRRTHGWFWWLVNKLTNSSYVHTSVAVWIDTGLYVAEMNIGGNRLIPLSQYRQTFYVFKPPIPNRDGIKSVALKLLRNRIKYAFIDALYIGLYNIVRLRLPLDKNGLICSSFCKQIYLLSGWSSYKGPRIPSPAELVNALGDNPYLQVQP